MSVHKAALIEVFTLENEFLKIEVLNYGAIIKSLKLKLEHEESQELVAGHPEVLLYLEDPWFLGACLGPFSGRIKRKNALTNTVDFPENTKKIELHGGKQAYSKQFWQLEKIGSGAAPFICLSYSQQVQQERVSNHKALKSGTIKTLLTYSLINSELKISYNSTSTIPQVFNLSNHSYFILDQAQDVSDYLLEINAFHRIQTDHQLLPTGKLLSLKNDAYHFSPPKKINQIRLDTPFVLNHKSELGQRAASLYSEKSKLLMEVYTDQEILVCFTPQDFTGICFETQGYPDAPSHENFKTIVIDKDRPYQQETRYKFEKTAE